MSDPGAAQARRIQATYALDQLDAAMAELGHWLNTGERVDCPRYAQTVPATTASAPVRHQVRGQWCSSTRPLNRSETKETTVQEPDDKALVLIGNLTDNDPWHLELWARDDTNAGESTARWFRSGLGEDADVLLMSWDRLEKHAAGRMDTLKVLGSGLA